MRLLIISICISSGLAYNNFNSFSSSSAIAGIPDVQLNLVPGPELRSKRDIRIHPLEDPNHCVRNCNNATQYRLNNVNKTGGEAVEAFCQALEPADACYKSCPDSKLRTLLIDYQPVIKQICASNDDKIQKCLNGIADEVAKQCNPVCNASSDAANEPPVYNKIKLNADPAFILYDDDKKKNTDSLRSACKSLTCQKECEESITKQRCGEKAVVVIRKRMSDIFGSVVKLYRDVDAIDGPIDECKPFL